MLPDGGMGTPASCVSRGRKSMAGAARPMEKGASDKARSDRIHAVRERASTEGFLTVTGFGERGGTRAAPAGLVPIEGRLDGRRGESPNRNPSGQAQRGAWGLPSGAVVAKPHSTGASPVGITRSPSPKRVVVRESTSVCPFSECCCLLPIATQCYSVEQNRLVSIAKQERQPHIVHIRASMPVLNGVLPSCTGDLHRHGCPKPVT